MCGGGGGQRGLEEEEKALLRMQTRVAEQGIAGRDQAMAGYRDFLRRGREMGSAANQDREAGRVMEDAYAAYGTANRMQDARLASMGVNPADARFSRGRDTGGVGMAAQAASGANQARRGARAESLQLEGAGLAGLGGFDPTGALSSMGSMIGNAQRTNAMSDAATAQGWGQLGQAGMYGLTNADKIGKGANTVAGWFGRGSSSTPIDSELGFAYGGMVPSYAEGGEVMGLPGYANGGNVYDTAFNQVGQARSQVARGPAPQQQSAMDPMTATKLAKAAVDKASSSSLGYSSAVPGLSSSAPGSQAAMLAEQTGAFGAEGLASTAAAGEAAAGAAGAEAALGAAGAEAAGAGLASGAAGASAALGAAVPILGLGMLAAGLFGRKDGGPIPRAASRPGIGRKQVAGKAQNSKGGKVSGPGGPKDDMVMARLSPGEYVLPVGAVKKYGLDRLEKMRQEGLAFERQRNIT